MTPTSLPTSIRQLSVLSWVSFGLALVMLAYLIGFFGYLTAYGPHLSIAGSMLKLYGYEEWEHCALVPFIALFLVWWLRNDVALLPVTPALSGVPILIFGFACFWLSYRLDDIYFAFIAIQTLLAGLIVIFFGWQWMRALFFPWIFMVFAWPLFFLDNVIAFPLRLIMTHLSTGILNLIGVATTQVGTSIQSAANPMTGLLQGQKFQVDVAAPCSGMRSLFALLMVSALFGYFTLKTVPQRVGLVIAAVPLAILGNLVRIMLLTFGVLIVGPEIAIGTLENPSLYHMAAGYFVFIVALGGMALVASMFRGQHKIWLRKFGALRAETRSAAKNRVRVARSSEIHDVY